MKHWLLVTLLLAGCVFQPPDNGRRPLPRPDRGDTDPSIVRDAQRLVPNEDDRYLHFALQSQLLGRIQSGKYATIKEAVDISQTATDSLRLPSLKEVGEDIEKRHNYSWNFSTSLKDLESEEARKFESFIQEFISTLEQTL